MDINVLTDQLRMTSLAAETSPSIKLQSLFVADAEKRRFKMLMIFWYLLVTRRLTIAVKLWLRLNVCAHFLAPFGAVEGTYVQRSPHLNVETEPMIK